jgi:Family of unknown function (DUF6290)
LYALRDNSSLSQIINQQLIEYLEDQEDIAAANKARKEVGYVSFDDAVKELGLDLHALRNSAKV